jgi:prepilin-type N-terminal cleavage/methylation domain-containing protein
MKKIILSVSPKKGFTIIELIIILAILAILIAFAIPKIDCCNFHLKTQGRLLCSEIRQIKILRMTVGEQHKITLSPNKYTIQNGTKDIKTIKLMPGYQLLYDLNRNKIMFQYSGAPMYGGSTIRIRNKKNGKYIELTIVPASGRVLLKEKILNP